MVPDVARFSQNQPLIDNKMMSKALKIWHQSWQPVQEEAGRTPENLTLFQGFEWYVPHDNKHWQRLRDAMPGLKAIGIDTMWIPPGCKAANPHGNGYDIYDLYDLGEFEQKGTVGTKWGTKEELVQMVDIANENGIGILWDAVLNHKAAADHPERCQAVKVDLKDRTKEISKPEEIVAWVGFDFNGRGERYSSMKYHWNHFSGTDWNDKTRTNAIYKILGKNKNGWTEDVDHELGNYDYLMFSDVDFSQPEVRDDVFRWGEWIGKELDLAGIRFDAIKHYSEDFLRDFIRHLDRTVGSKWFLVGEYWKDDLKVLSKYLDRFNNRISLFDVTLVNNFSRISMSGERGDLRDVFDGTLALNRPDNAVTFVMNHDTQPHQSLEAKLAPFWAPLGYALILLRAGGLPCVFYGDLFGIKGPSPAGPTCGGKLPLLILARKLFAYGPEHDYFDNSNCIGFTRHGTPSRPTGLACLMTNLPTYAHKRMYVGRAHIGERWTDILSWAWGEVVIDKRGYGTFPVGPRSVAVWVDRRARGRQALEELTFDWDIYHEFS